MYLKIREEVDKHFTKIFLPKCTNFNVFYICMFIQLQLKQYGFAYVCQCKTISFVFQTDVIIDQSHVCESQ